jgi:hypothetical protein
MFRLHALRKLTAHLALFAVLLHAFAPAVSHAMMAKSGKSLVEICTAQGFKLVEVDSGTAADLGKSKPGIKVAHECAVCAAASAPPLPPTEVIFLDMPAPHAGIIAVSSSTFAFADALHLSPPPTGPPVL